MSTSRRSPARWLLALLAAFALLAAACGDDDDTATDTDDGTDLGQDGDGDATAPDHPAGSTMARIAEAGSITIGTKFDQPLFGLVDPRTGEPEGFDVEIAKLIARSWEATHLAHFEKIHKAAVAKPQ